MFHADGLLVGSWGLALVFLNVLLEQAGLPIPAIPMLLLAGALAVRHPEWGAAAFALAVAACVISDSAWYGAGRVYGGRIVRLLCRISLSPDSCVSETQLQFERWGIRAVLVSKFVPGLSTLAPPLAGALRMALSLFLAMSFLGSVLWVAVFMVLGELAAPEITALLPHLGALGARAVLTVALLLAFYILLKWWQRQRLYAALRMARVDASELHSMLQGEPAPTILDVRSRSARALDPRAIPGALHVPPEDIAARISTVQLGAEVIVYCSCPNEASAARVAKLLMRHGVGRVRPLLGGLEAWAARGYPVTSVPLAVAVTAPNLASPQG
ncbi:MAG TPA: VTT domain-containing protein [Steroidobacteraceae bacterium]|nr:VTT domain-containing protein [Steroidobacteraceae bacterium]